MTSTFDYDIDDDGDIHVREILPHLQLGNFCPIAVIHEKDAVVFAGFLNREMEFGWIFFDFFDRRRYFVQPFF